MSLLCGLLWLYSLLLPYPYHHPICTQSLTNKKLPFYFENKWATLHNSLAIFENRGEVGIQNTLNLTAGRAVLWIWSMDIFTLEGCEPLKNEDFANIKLVCPFIPLNFSTWPIGKESVHVLHDSFVITQHSSIVGDYKYCTWLYYIIIYYIIYI